MNQDSHDLLAGLVLERFSGSPSQAIAAWKRMLQNDGWDNAQGREEWLAMANRGIRKLQEKGLIE